MRSKELFPALGLCAAAPLLLQSYDILSGFSAASATATAAVFALGFAALFLPPYLLSLKTGGNVFTLSEKLPPKAQIIIPSLYSIFFVFVSASALTAFSNMMNACINPDANAYFLGFCILLACVYTAVKGFSALRRCSVIILAFVLLSAALIFGGNISNIEFSNLSFGALDFEDALRGASAFVPMSVTATIFAVLCSDMTRARVKRLIIFLIGIIIATALTLFFVIAVLGSFGGEFGCSLFTLSKSAFNGVDFFFLSAVTAGVFALVSVNLICINKSVKTEGSVKSTAVFAALIFLLFICSKAFKSVGDILQSPYFMGGACFLTAVIVPLIYLIIFKVRHNA